MPVIQTITRFLLFICQDIATKFTNNFQIFDTFSIGTIDGYKSLQGYNTIGKPKVALLPRFLKTSP